MKMIDKLWRMFQYAGVGKDEYNELLPAIRRENTALLKVFSLIAAGMFFLLFIASRITAGFATVNTSTYLFTSLAMILILLCARSVFPKHPALVMVFVYIFEILLYLFGIRISLLHTELPAVSAVAFLLVTPLLFYDRPVRLSALITAVVVVFCGMVVHFKEPKVVQSDVWNVITYGIVAIVVTIFIMSIKIRTLSQSRQIEYMSRTDLLTGVKNRNHYEKRLQEYPGLRTSTLICVYADVNGLHEMNNKQGHPAGDKMLREVAKTMQHTFGPEHTYRVGGDEFVAFRVDGEPEALSSEIDHMRQKLSIMGYNVSFGIAVYAKNAQDDLNMVELVREAEQDMFAAKRAFYRQAGNDRRSR